MNTLVLVGCSLGNDVFTTHAEIFGAEITWNVTRLRRAANDGVFGFADRIPMSALPPMSSLADSNIEWDKVHGMIAKHSRGGLSGPLAEPAINVGVQIGEKQWRIPVDGNHRICAWRMLGLEFWATYNVPPEIEGQYRVREIRR